eukprot:927436_1
MHPQINVNPQQLQQLIQLQQMRQQAQFQQNNRGQVQIFASPPNPTTQISSTPNQNTNPSTKTLFQLNTNNNNGLNNNINNNVVTVPTGSSNGHNNVVSNNGIQFQPLQILQMAQTNGNNNSNIN